MLLCRKTRHCKGSARFSTFRHSVRSKTQDQVTNLLKWWGSKGAKTSVLEDGISRNKRGNESRHNQDGTALSNTSDKDVIKLASIVMGLNTHGEQMRTKRYYQDAVGVIPKFDECIENWAGREGREKRGELWESSRITLLAGSRSLCKTSESRRLELHDGAVAAACGIGLCDLGLKPLLVAVEEGHDFVKRGPGLPLWDPHRFYQGRKGGGPGGGALGAPGEVTWEGRVRGRYCVTHFEC